MPCSCTARPYKTVKRMIPQDADDDTTSKKRKSGDNVKVVYERTFRKICLRGFANRELEQMMVRGLLR